MNTTTTTTDLTKDVLNLLLNSISEGTKKAFRMIWDLIMSFAIHHWILVTVALLGILIFAVFQGIAGRWWVLGSVLYNYLYFGFLWLVGSIWGPEVFAGTYADIGFFLLYILCFIVVGRILTQTGLKRR